MLTMLTRMAGGDGQRRDTSRRPVKPGSARRTLRTPVKEIDPYDLDVHHEITWRNVTRLVSSTSNATMTSISGTS